MSSALFQTVVEATRGEYVLHGTLGQSDALGNAFLAREVSTGRSVLLVVPPDAESLDVVGALSDAIAADAGGCAACGFRIGSWVDACPRCEHTLLPPPGPSPEAAALREQLRDSIDVVGSLPHVRGGTLYFGHDAVDRRLTAFAVRPKSDGQLELDVVWEAAPDSAAQSAAPSITVPPRTRPLGDGSGRPSEYGQPAYSPTGYDQADVEPPAYGGAVTDGYSGRADRVGDLTPDGPARSRRLLPIGLGVGALALVGAAAFAFTRHTPAAPIPPVGVADTTTKIALNSPPPPITPPPQPGVPPTGASTGVGGSFPPVSASDSARQARRRWRDSVRAVRLQEAANGATLTIDGDLPNGWTRTINGAGESSAREVPLPIGTPVVIRIEAPGYCADTLLITPAPKGRQHWAPTLRGKSLVGDC